MGHLPFFKFYPGDWLRDTTILSLEGQGAWLKILCALHFSETRGRKTMFVDSWRRYLGFPDDNDERALKLIDELAEVAQIIARDKDENVCETLREACTITIISKRMERDEVERIQELERKRRYEKKRPTRRRRKPDVKPTPILQTSEVRSQKSESKESASVERKKLNPKIAEVAQRIYDSDKARYARLIVWIKESQKHAYDDDAIVGALIRFEPLAPKVRDWYPYLDRLIVKVHGDLNAARHDAEHKARKDELRAASLALFGKEH